MNRLALNAFRSAAPRESHSPPTRTIGDTEPAGTSGIWRPIWYSRRPTLYAVNAKFPRLRSLVNDACVAKVSLDFHKPLGDISLKSVLNDPTEI